MTTNDRYLHSLQVMMRLASSRESGHLALPCSCIFWKVTTHLDQDPRSYVSMYVSLSTLTSLPRLLYIYAKWWIWTMGYLGFFWKIWTQSYSWQNSAVRLWVCDKWPWFYLIVSCFFFHLFVRWDGCDTSFFVSVCQYVVPLKREEVKTAAWIHCLVCDH